MDYEALKKLDQPTIPHWPTDQCHTHIVNYEPTADTLNEIVDINVKIALFLINEGVEISEAVDRVTADTAEDIRTAWGEGEYVSIQETHYRRIKWDQIARYEVVSELVQHALDKLNPPPPDPPVPAVGDRVKILVFILDDPDPTPVIPVGTKGTVKSICGNPFYVAVEFDNGHCADVFYSQLEIEPEPEDDPYDDALPTIQQLQDWESRGICEATDGCTVEPDGTCEHGKNSWLLELGYI